MSRPNWKEIKNDYIKHNGKVKLKELAKKHNVKYSTLRSRKNREKWDDELKTVATKTATQQKNVATKKVDRKIVREVAENNNLNDKQKLFCIYYTKYFNATKAYQKAYQCDYITANTNGPRLLVKASIKEQIQKLKAAKLKGAFLEEGDLLQKYIDIAFADITDYVEFGNTERVVAVDNEGNPIKAPVNYIDLKSSDEVDGSLITEVKTSRQGVSVKLEDRMKALEWLTRFFEMNPEHQYKKEFDRKKLQLERERFEHQKEVDERNVW